MKEIDLLSNYPVLKKRYVSKILEPLRIELQLLIEIKISMMEKEMMGMEGSNMMVDGKLLQKNFLIFID